MADMLISTVTTCVGIPTIAFTVSSLARYVMVRRAVLEVTTQIEQHAITNDTHPVSLIASSIADISPRIKSRLRLVTPHFDRAQRRPSKQNLTRLADDISAASRDIVRIVRSNALNANDTTPPRDRDWVFSSGVIRAALWRPLASPWLAGALLVASTTLEYTRSSDIFKLFSYVISIFLGAFLFHWVGLLTRSSDRRTRAIAMWGVLLLLPATEWYALSVARIATGPETPAAILLFWVVVIVLCLLTSAIAHTAEETRALSRELAIRRAIVHDLAGPSALADVDFRRQTALFLHGPIQGRMESIALMIRNVAGQTKPSSRAAMLESVRTSLNTTYEDLMELQTALSSPRDEPLEAALNHISEIWSGLVLIRWSVGSNIAEKLDNKSRDILIHVVTDMITNAARHARAEKADLSIEEDKGVICITCLDDGYGLKSERSCDGLVAQALAEIGGTWAVSSREKQGARSVARIPLTHKKGPR
ncbi:hypothetical protein FHS05_001332 [Microbacterium endophyticum]|nr:hypothetical protein [Microbacterium endophyticum]NIK36307.1 hypothetical protein [Microbacterium endophyticum]